MELWEWVLKYSTISNIFFSILVLLGLSKAGLIQLKKKNGLHELNRKMEDKMDSIVKKLDENTVKQDALATYLFKPLMDTLQELNVTLGELRTELNRRKR